MRRLLRVFFLGCVIFSAGALQAQSFTVTGKVIDAATKQPIPYATVALVDTTAQQILAGASTTADGSFSVKTANPNFAVDVSFIGYEKQVITSFDRSSPTIDLGTIQLKQSALALEEAEVRAERSMVEFKLDKRVFNVGKDISSTGAGALEVLSNVPSVTVDIEGNIKLRGNSGVQILINGKPSVMSEDGSLALGTITADMIDRVEVITNPSAKYEAGGTSGIINIVLKEEEKKGFNGSVSANTGLPDNHSIGASLNYRTENLNLFTQFGTGYRSIPTLREALNINKIDSTAVYSEGEEYRNEVFYNIRLGSDFFLNDYNTLTVSGSYALELERQPSETEFSIYDLEAPSIPTTERTEETTATNPKWQYELQYEKIFKDDEEHKLELSAIGGFFGKDLESEFTDRSLIDDSAPTLQRTETSFYRADYTFKLDYTDPINELFTIEAGAQYDINNVGNDFTVLNQVGDEFVADSNFTNTFEWNQKVLGVYGTAAYEGDVWGVKLGLRVENTDLQTLLVTTDEANDQNYTNFFPTVHSSWKMTDVMSFQAGYSRRIFRPRLWDLNPFFNIRNQFNIRQGNPDLQPEFADSYEITWIYLLNKASLNASIYHLYTQNVIERVSFFEDNVNITQPENIGTSNKTGFEFNAKYDPVDWVTLNGDFNYGVFVRRGTFQDQNFDFTGDQWTARLNAKLKLSKTLDVELTGNYESAFQTVQGRVSGFAFMNAGVRWKIMKNKGVLNLGVRDVFASRIRENVIDNERFYLYSWSQRGRFVTLGFSYSFGKGEAMNYTGRVR
jgi:outer membrane receptor protein involved in Fe transport